MPRRSVQKREPNRRSRTGCQCCRKRKIKCDESKPSCGQCSLKGLRCDNIISLKWEIDYQLKGLAFGRAGVWFKGTEDKPPSPRSPGLSCSQEWLHVPPIHSYSFLNSTVGHNRGVAVYDYDDDGPWGLVSSNGTTIYHSSDEASSIVSLSSSLGEPEAISLSSPLELHLNPFQPLHSPEESNLLSYFFEKVSPRDVPKSVSVPPLASIIFPYSVSRSPIAFQSLLALAACHRSRSDQSYSSMALTLNEKVVQHLRSRITMESLEAVVMDHEPLVLMMILCLFEIVFQSGNGWVVHLKGARDLIRLRRQIQATTSVPEASSEPIACAEKFFAFQDVIGRTACGESPIFGSDFWTADSAQCDSWLGCSPQLIGILCSVTELSRCHIVDPFIQGSFEYQAQAASLERQLENLQQNINLATDCILARSAELKRCCVELYLHCALYGATPAMPLVKDRVPGVLHMTSILLHAGVTAGLTWPIFLAAVELDPWDEDVFLMYDGTKEYCRPFILRALDDLSESISNVRRTRSVIEKVWAVREAHDFDLVDNDQTDPRNDWERCVAPFCAQMSLA